MSVKNNAIPTLFEWAGGQKVFDDLFSRFYEKVREDAILSPVFRNMSAAHAKHVANFIIEVFGGPQLYTQADGKSHAEMVSHHIGKFLNEEKRKRWVQLLLETADESGMPDDPEFRASLAGYLEWGSRLAVINSNSDQNTIKDDEPMPEWGWGETGGPYLPEKKI